MPTRSLTRFPAAAVLGALAVLAPVLQGAAAHSAGAGAPRVDRQAVEAARLMERSLGCLRHARGARGLPIDTQLDPNGTGLIGDEFTPLTTSLGDVAAKRTSANPAFAAAVAGYFHRLDTRPGDVIAVGASGSLPGLLLATLSAARALDLEPVVIYSIGSSMYGANLPGFTFVEMLESLRRDGLLPYHLAAISPGGRDDSGAGVLFDEEGTTLVAETRRSGLPEVGGTSLADRIQRRLAVYDAARRGRPIRAFVNIGGSSANFGETMASLDLPNGLVMRAPRVPDSPTRGLVFEFAARGIPVVHLLHVRGIADANRLPFDPVPFPPVGQGDVYRER